MVLHLAYHHAVRGCRRLNRPTLVHALPTSLTLPIHRAQRPGKSVMENLSIVKRARGPASSASRGAVCEVLSELRASVVIRYDGRNMLWKRPRADVTVQRRHERSGRPNFQLSWGGRRQRETELSSRRVGGTSQQAQANQKDEMTACGSGGLSRCRRG